MTPVAIAPWPGPDEGLTVGRKGEPAPKGPPLRQLQQEDTPRGALGASGTPTDSAEGTGTGGRTRMRTGEQSRPEAEGAGLLEWT